MIILQRMFYYLPPPTETHLNSFCMAVNVTVIYRVSYKGQCFQRRFPFKACLRRSQMHYLREQLQLFYIYDVVEHGLHEAVSSSTPYEQGAGFCARRLTPCGHSRKGSKSTNIPICSRQTDPHKIAQVTFSVQCNGNSNTAAREDPGLVN